MSISNFEAFEMSLLVLGNSSLEIKKLSTNCRVIPFIVADTIRSFTLVLNSGFSISFKETDYCGKYELSTSQNLESSLVKPMGDHPDYSN